MSRARLEWRCRRGMKELDVLLQAWLGYDYLHAAPDERDAFSRLLDESDDTLWRYFYQDLTPVDPSLAAIVHRIRHSAAHQP